MKKAHLAILLFFCFLTVLKPVLSENESDLAFSVNIIDGKVSINLTTEKDIYENKEKIKYKFYLSENVDEFVIEYGVEDIFGNMVKDYRNTTNTNQKSYTPSIKEKEKILVIKGNLFINNEFVDSAEKMIIVKNSVYEEDIVDLETDQENEEDEEDNEEKKKLSYQLIDPIDKIFIGQEFSNKLKINNEDKGHKFEVWSYVYRSSKSYSGEREGNKKTIELAAGETETIILNNIVEEAEPGDYKFKVRIRKDNQKTTDEITRDIVIKEAEQDEINETEEENFEEVQNEEKNNEINYTQKESISINNTTNSTIVYESKSTKIKKNIIYILLAFLVMMVVILVWRS